VNKFKEVPASKKSIGQRRLVRGIGSNDAKYMVTQDINGKQITCPYYKRWHNMIERCYSNACQEKYPTYKGCTVSYEWLTFSNFKAWMVKQDWQGMHLDKDIKIKGNKVYSEETCLFIPSQLNRLLNNRRVERGLLPQGVSMKKQTGRFESHICEGSKLRYLGYFKTVKEASLCYQKARSKKIHNIINSNIYPMASQYLAQHINVEDLR